jgi:hypothetical protein
MRLGCTLNDGLQRYVEITCKIHKANCEFRGHLFMHFLLVQLIEILSKMFLELLQTLLYLLLFLLHYSGVLKILHLHLGDGGKHLHVLTKLKADQVR